MLTILIVDDEWTIREGLKKTVPWNEWGIEVAGTATNGNEALEVLEELPVDILLTDIRMPGVNGLELSSVCKEKYPNLKVVILTGHDDFEYAQKAVKLGADDFLLKPTNMDELKKAMHKITREVDRNHHEKGELLTLLIKDLIENHSLDNITKLRAHKEITPNFGIVILQSVGVTMKDVKLSNVILLLDKEGRNIYFCHSIKNEAHWDEIINAIKNNVNNSGQNAKLNTSLLANDLSQLVNIYKQANTASMIYYKNNLITIYKYRDEKYTLDFEDIIRLINRHYKEQISQVGLAKQLNMSNSYFSKLFKQHTSMNFVEYITMKRMEVAKELLTSTTLKTYEIANEVGYTESRYFSQLFKKTTGCTPMEFRKGFSQTL